MIEVTSFTKKYDDFIAVDNLSMTVKNNCISGLLGPNGAGKTTLLKAICGIHYPTSGQILINNISVEDDSITTKKMIGFVSEIPSFYPQFTVNEYLSFANDVKNSLLTKNEKKETFEKIILQTHLQDVLQKKISTLSKGYKQRLSLAQSIIGNPEILILDEPVSGLDPIQIHEMRLLISELAKTKTVLLSTHLMQEVSALCENLFIINKGVLVAEGTKEQICQKTNCSTIDDAFLQLTINKDEQNE